MRIPKEEHVLIKRYKVRKTGQGGRSLETTIPRMVFEREAKRVGLSVEDALNKFLALWKFDSFEGLYLCFELKKNPLVPAQEMKK